MKLKREFLITDKEIRNKYLKNCCKFTIGNKNHTTSLTGFLIGFGSGILAAYILLSLLV